MIRPMGIDEKYKQLQTKINKKPIFDFHNYFLWVERKKN